MFILMCPEHNDFVGWEYTLPDGGRCIALFTDGEKARPFCDAQHPDFVVQSMTLDELLDELRQCLLDGLRAVAINPSPVTGQENRAVDILRVLASAEEPK
jgi:hypothetical protein